MKVRPIHVNGDVAIVTLTKGYKAIIDASDVGIVEGRNWSALVSPHRKPVYAVRVENEKMILMHRAIIGARSGMDVDHIDGNGLNNRRSNIRECTRSENCRNVGVRADNKSGQKGVRFCKENNKWQSEIVVNNKKYFLGYFQKFEDAVAAYARACSELHGEYARPS